MSEIELAVAVLLGVVMGITVKSGDSLSAIASANGLTLKALLASRKTPSTAPTRGSSTRATSSA